MIPKLLSRGFLLPSNGRNDLCHRLGWRRLWLNGISLLFALSVESQAFTEPTDDHQSTSVWNTNGPAVFAFAGVSQMVVSNQASKFDIPLNAGSPVFEHFLPASLNNYVWTNLIAHTNGRDTSIWVARSHSKNWPRTGPLVRWSTNGLMWGMRGVTALSPCWENEKSPSQVPITALTPRHGYTRGHGMGPNGFDQNGAGQKIWFLTADNILITRSLVRRVVRTRNATNDNDYTIILFDKDLPDSIQSMRVADPKQVLVKYCSIPPAPWPLFLTEQTGHVSGEIPGFRVPTWNAGDSGSPNMLPMPGELVFIGGRSTSGPSEKMQKDMDELCRLEKLSAKRYQLQWIYLSVFPSL